MTSKLEGGLTRRRFIQGMGGGLALATLGSAPAFAARRQLVVTSDLDPGQYVVFKDIVAEFGRQTGVQVTLNNIAQEANKIAIRNYLVADPPDICFWFSGERMRQFVQLGLFADISKLVAQQDYAKALGPLLDTVTVDGQQYGLPLGGLFWGLYYRADVFAKHGLIPPKTFEDFHRTCEAAQRKGLIPVAMGTKAQWPAAGWFDHLNLRINGLEKHMALMRGEMAYSDASLDPVFNHWAEMIHRGFFLKHGTSYAWQQAATFLAQGKAAMMDLANFIQGAMPPAAVKQLRLFRFPMYDPAIGPFEDFATNSIHIPARAPHPDVARDFLAYFYQPEVLGKFIAPVGSVPPRRDMPVGDNRLVRTATALLRATKGTSQYYDRDTKPAMARAGLNGFQEFTVYPQRGKAIRAELDRVRRRVYGT